MRNIFVLASVATALVASSVHALFDSFEHDGKTTYCWSIPENYGVKLAPWSDKVLESKGSGCPVSMEISVAKTKLAIGEYISATWTVTLERSRLKSNDMQTDQYYQTNDKVTGDTVDIIHAAVHSCEYGSNCDSFRIGNKYAGNTPIQVAKLNGKDSYTFTSTGELKYSQSGDYSVMAHVIFPGNTSQSRFDYAAYTRLSVSTETAGSSAGDSTSGAKGGSGSSGGGLSTTVVVIIIVASVVFVLIVVVCICCFKRRNTGRKVSRPQPAFFAGSPTGSPHSYDKNYGPYPNNEIVGSGGPSMNSLKPSPYQQYSGGGSSSHPTSFSSGGSGSRSYASGNAPPSTHYRPGEPPLFNREGQLRYMESTRSYQYEVNTQTRQKEPAKIFSTQNSIDFVYPDTDSSIDMVDTTYRKQFADIDDSTRSRESMDSYGGFLVESNNSAHVFDFDDTNRSSGYSYAGVTSAEAYGYADESNRSYHYKDDLDTRQLNTTDLRKMHVEI
ncbi:hypothetical protein Poli38472_005400 [Pythium oligandrum]|uniref:Uncharacterized protein n=1 Tax=Pythium oligandrum TaxID=41045 RepID=A0A8K1CG91_PYTOL|nr:hypothetical protein Poli38472_005400 [Pythium oligandrum]|eukprot:TMW62782.1 hypothetical protein Poli38472_005400 [Pythium oligandrum]